MTTIPASHAGDVVTNARFARPGSDEWLTDPAHPDRWRIYLLGYEHGARHQAEVEHTRRERAWTDADMAEWGTRCYADGEVQGRHDHEAGRKAWVARDLETVLVRAERRGTLAELAERYRGNPGPLLEALDAVQRLIEDEAYRETRGTTT
jgi:hypothetical protein